jgi:glycosyltransferase involved in cell wall biosynthesis
VLDLARELDRLGLETLLYSYVPVSRAERFGLPSRCQRGLLPLVAPLVAWQNYAGKVMPERQERAMAHALDAAVKLRLAPCDIFICMSGMYLDAARYARKRFGAQIWLERGSRHILSQREILATLGARGPTDFIVERELAGYELADRIVVPSSHVVESFVEKAPHLAGKLFVNPYGVDLAQFPMRISLPPEKLPTVIFVGGWSRRKGCDLLVEAVRSLEGVRLLHVGAIVDLDFPDDPRFEHVDPVPQWQLREHYCRAHVFALASREEGLALVQAQALASGLPVVCTSRTGGADLRLSPALSKRIEVTATDDMLVFSQGLRRMLDFAMGGSLPSLSEADRALLAWPAYGQRYRREIVKSITHRETRPADVC